ncbi:MAG: hypothetical protein SGARI_002394 [Bacillariaceae sp.]
MPGNHVICSPPAMISLPLDVALKLQKEQEPNKPVEEMRKPEWLETPEETKKRLKAEKKAKKEAKKEAKKNKNAGHRRSKSMVSLGTEERENAMRPEIVQRSFSEEDAPTAVHKNSEGHRRTVSSPSFNGIVVGPGGRPMFTHQAEAEAEKAAAEENTPTQGNVEELMQINYDDHRPRLDSAGDAIDPATSFTESYQTYSTFYESSMEPQMQQQQQQQAVIVSPSPRKGMVRRQFFGRIFRKSNNATTPVEQPETKIKKTTSKDKTAKTVNTSLADWKQSSSSCMV